MLRPYLLQISVAYELSQSNSAPRDGGSINCFCAWLSKANHASTKTRRRRIEEKETTLMTNSFPFIGHPLAAAVVLSKASLSISQSAIETANPFLVSIFHITDTLRETYFYHL